MNTSQSKDHTLGQELLARRKALGWSMEEAAHVTKLRMDVIAKIEEDRFDLLPNHAYARGFVRIYARELGLDIFAVLKKLDGIVGEEVEWAELRPESLEVLPPKSNLQRIRARHIGLVVILGVIAITVGILGLQIYRIIPERYFQKAKLVETITPAKVETVKPAGAIPTNAVTVPPRAEAKKKEAESIRRAEPVAITPVAPAISLNHLRLRADQECYVQVKATKGGEDVLLFEGIIPAGATMPDPAGEPWSADTFHLTIRDIQQVTIIYNDKESKREGQGVAQFSLPAN